MDALKQEYLVTKTETVKIAARSEDEALFLAEQCFDFFGSDTTDIQVEKLKED